MTQNRPEETTAQLYLVADELRSLANTGLTFSKHPLALERFEKILMATARLVSILDNQPFEVAAARFIDNQEHLCPLLGVETAVFRDNRLLLIKRYDDGLWAVPGGLVEVGDTLPEAALRELREETGLDGSIMRLLGIFDSRLWGTQSRFHFYHVIFEVDTKRGTPETTVEATDWGFFGAGELPDLSPGHDKRVPILFKLKDGSMEVPYID